MERNTLAMIDSSNDELQDAAKIRQEFWNGVELHGIRRKGIPPYHTGCDPIVTETLQPLLVQPYFLLQLAR